MSRGEATKPLLVAGYLALAMLGGAVRVAWAAPIEPATGPSPARVPGTPPAAAAVAAGDPGTPGLARHCLGTHAGPHDPVSDTELEFSVATVDCRPRPAPATDAALADDTDDDETRLAASDD